MSAEIREDLDIAVIGLSGRFPGAENCDAYWRNLLMGIDCTTRFSEEALLQAGHDPAKIRNRDFVPVNGALPDAQCFDAEFFGYSQAEAALMDPQTRLMLQCVWHALENAGVDPERRGRNIGLFLGARSTVQWTMQAMLSGQVENVGGFLASQLSNKDAMSTLISWKLGLEGPSFTLQTACSTSLVSIHQAAQSLLCGECDFAVAGGASLLLPQQNGHTYQEGMLFSRDGKTRAFDADASGSVFGSGLGAVVLRRAGDAIADNDPIWAILKGSAINNDGARKVGYTAPSVKGQAQAIRAAWEVAEVEAADLDFIECHGTATALGDSIEFMALQQAFGGGGAPNQCALGAVKSNIGHLDSAAGVAGFIKMVLALRHGVIPPTLHFQRPNPQLDFDGSPFYVNTRAQPWPARAGRPRTGGVSSFGIGGTNAHAVLQQYLPAHPAPGGDGAEQVCLLPFSARNRPALRRQLEAMSQWLVSQSGLDLRALSHTLGQRRGLPCRAMLAADSRFALMRAIERYLALDDDADPLALFEREDGWSGKREAIADWLSGKTKEAGAGLLGSFDGPALLDVPGYVFARDEHGAGHIADRTWAQIAGIIAAPEGRNASRNAPGMLTPFWKPVRVPAAGAAVRAVLLADSALDGLAAQAAAGGVETVSLNLLCPEQLGAALARLSAAADPAQALSLTLAFPAAGFSFAEASLQALAGLGRALAEADFSAFASAHIYLLVPEAREAAAEHVLTAAALKSLALVAPQEIPGIDCAFLSIRDPEPAALAALLRAPMSGPLRLTGDGLFAEDFRCPDAEENETLDEADFAGKTYAISGAGGRMAREMALAIARRFRGKLALISRQAADSPAMLSLRRELEAAGAAAVEVFPYALESEAEALSLFQSIRGRLGDIFAMIHAAGVTDGDSFRALAQLDAGAYLAQLGPKARAAQTLARVFEIVPVRYCFATSSMSAFFGGIAHAPYAAANLFLDGWGQVQNRRPGAPRWVVVNWETVHFDADGRGDAQAWGANEEALSGAEFPAWFERSLREYDRENQKIFSAGRFVERLYAWGGRRAAAGGREQAAVVGVRLKPRPEALATAYLAPETAMQRDIAAIWSGILGVEGVGADDRFMELGGDSLKTIVMAEKVYKKLGKRIAIQDFFAQPTIREIERQCLLESAAEDAGLPAVDPAAPIVASADQELLYIHQTTFRDASYNMPVAFQCPGAYGADAIADAIERVADRHPVLKCLFERRGADLLMLPQLDARVGLRTFEAAAETDEDRARLEAFAGQPFDLHAELPMRAMMVAAKGAGQPHQVLIVVHHIVCDAVSLGILADDFQNLLAGRDLPAPEYSFAAYRRQRQSAENAEQTRKDKAYWLGNLLPLPAPLALPTLDGHDSRDGHQGATRVRSLSAPASEAVKRLCGELGVSTFSFFLGAFGVLMSKIAHAESFLLGVPVTGRAQAQELALVGYLVNMRAMKIEPEPDFPVAEYLLDLNAQWLESAPHQGYPMSALLDDLSGEDYCQGRQGRHPLFDVVFGYLPFSLNGAEESGGDFVRLELASDTAKFDLAVEVSETGEAFDCTIQYRERLFAESTIAALFDYYFGLIDAVLADPEAEVGSLLPGLDAPAVAGASSQADQRDVDLEFDF
ncbi:beta-ketoacyl synthase N-terminal-like domain-containing protein [Chromobacterium subtsugae]|uniref:beta-ketoacyl synthase N-terminal-like domain-containing protein n=1 Tax=Chromobacterium subtsugae TaxID=251747 RepID=UPI0007F8E04A|nr:beta-ketoacyl synthase N-terminal-like domain-containing protein [Chromobacterium subtsugae]OBU85975.1 polyketide synthase [Chromobacterium subtsugae]